LIDAVLPRRTSLVRQAAGEAVAAQLMAANVDTVLVATSANRDLNERRIERYVAAIWESGALPVVVVTKADLSDDLTRDLRRVAGAAPGVPALAVSVHRGEGLEALAPYLKPGATLAVVGSSGVGKSTLVNWLLGRAVQVIQSIGDGLDKGRHTTTARSLFVLPGGALLIDTPGIREIAPWDAEDGTAATYADVEALVAQCRFADCRHETEPDCAVKAALEQGVLDQGRLDGYAKMRREQAHQARKADKHLELEEKKRWKQISRDVRTRMREKGGK
jgi:ribosome biogenesis GTPase